MLNKCFLREKIPRQQTFFAGKVQDESNSSNSLRFLWCPLLCQADIQCNHFVLTRAFWIIGNITSILQWGKVKVTQSCPTLCDAMDYTVYGILQARTLEWFAFPFSRGFSQPRDRTGVSCIAGRSFTNWAIREAPQWGKLRLKNGNCPVQIHTTSMQE